VHVPNQATSTNFRQRLKSGELLLGTFTKTRAEFNPLKS
jgi:hypothetical protein